jgi:signal transduction histidine kinase
LNEGEGGLFERMQHAAQRMGLLVDDLLMYSHVSQTPVEQEEVDLNEKLRIVLADLEVQIEEKKAVISVGHLPTVKGYRRQLQQLFQNLLTNALKYSKEAVAPQISVRSRIVSGAEAPYKLPEEYTNKRYHLIEVRDNGIGFEQQYADKIFQMFQRLHGKSEYTGTGVGLSIVRKVVENHHGFIWAESEPDKGATFYVLFPV